MKPRSVAELESALRSVARDVTYPTTPQITAAVIERVRTGPARPAEQPRRRLRYALAAAAILLLVVGATVTLSPTARRAVAGWIEVDGIRITFDEDVPRSDPVGEDLYLGAPATPEEARAAVDFDILVPQALGEPDSYFVLRYVEGGEVSLAWEPGPGLPESAHTGVGAVLTQFVGEAVPETFKKTAAVGTDVTAVTVDGHSGFFVEGAPHILVRPPSGGERVLAPRLAGNTLLWDAGEVTYRLEAEVGLARAVEIAESLDD